MWLRRSATAFHIPNHYRSFVDGVGEVELDALYVGVDKMGTLYVLPIEAKSQAESELIGRVQVSQMAKLVRQDFANLRRRILLCVRPHPFIQEFSNALWRG